MRGVACVSHGEGEVIPAGGLFVNFVEASAGEHHGSNPAVPLGAAALERRELESGDVVNEIVGGLETGERP
jgi:hypothetical protein